MDWVFKHKKIRNYLSYFNEMEWWSWRPTPAATIRPPGKDIRRVLGCIAHVRQQPGVCIDERRVVVCGWSDGGSFAYRLAVSLDPGTFAAVGALAAAPFPLQARDSIPAPPP